MSRAWWREPQNHVESAAEAKSTKMAAVDPKLLSPPEYCRFAIPKKGRLHEKVLEILQGAGIKFRREPRLDVALAVDLPITLVFLPASDIAMYVGEGNVDIGITGYDVIKESGVEVNHIMDLGIGKCKLCVQAPVADKIANVESLAGKRVVTSFPELTKQFFKPLDEKMGASTKISVLSGSVEAACGLGLADAIVDLVETGTTMKVGLLRPFHCMTTQRRQNSNITFNFAHPCNRPLGWKSYPRY